MDNELRLARKKRNTATPKEAGAAIASIGIDRTEQKMREGETAKSVSESTVALMWCFFRPDIDELRPCYVSMKKKNYVRTRRPVVCRMLRGAMVRFWRGGIVQKRIGP